MQSRMACRSCCIYTNELECFCCGKPTVDSAEVKDPTVTPYRDPMLAYLDRK